MFPAIRNARGETTNEAPRIEIMGNDLGVSSWPAADPQLDNSSDSFVGLPDKRCGGVDPGTSIVSGGGGNLIPLARDFLIQNQSDHLASLPMLRRARKTGNKSSYFAERDLISSLQYSLQTLLVFPKTNKVCTSSERDISNPDPITGTAAYPTHI